MKKGKRSPKEAISNEKVCALRTDHFNTPDFWIMATEKTVSICEQKTGESSKAIIEIPRGQFNKLIKWYTRPQSIIKRK